MNIKRNVIFSLENRKRNGVPIVNNVPIRMRVTYARHRIEFTTGYRIDAAKWDAAKQRVRNGCNNKLKQAATEINADLNNYFNTIHTIFKEFEVQDTIPTPDQLKDVFSTRCGNNADAPAAGATFFIAFDEFTREMGSLNNWTKATYTMMGVVKRHLQNFKADLAFSDLNEAGLSDYVSYLRDTRGMRNTTVGKQMGFLKWFLRWATANGVCQTLDYVRFKPKLKTTEKKIIFLDRDELMTVYNYEFANKTLERVRDVFCFCCFTSLRYSDVANLRRTDIFDDHIALTTVKTADAIRIELNKYSRAILAKYADVEFPGNLALPIMSNQKMNDYLKDVGKACGIDTPITITYYRGNKRIDEVHPKYELLGTHAGRRTFICFMLSEGTSPQIVMKWTGHSDYAAMKPYIDIVDSAKVEAMNKFNEL